MRGDNVIYQTITNGRPDLKSTVISIVPFEIKIDFPGLIPGRYSLNASDGETPQLLVVSEAKHHVYIDPDRGQLQVMDPSYQVAQSIVEDFCQGQLAAKPGCHPGIFWEVGEWSLGQVREQFAGRLKDMAEIQDTWFLELVRLADDDWEKTRQHFMISDTQREAARSLIKRNKLRDTTRPWLMSKPRDGEIENLKLMLCPACYSEVPEKAAVCRFCSAVINPEAAAKIKFADGASIAASVLKGK